MNCTRDSDSIATDIISKFVEYRQVSELITTVSEINRIGNARISQLADNTQLNSKVLNLCCL